ncbi:hypothetical protein [Pseudomonas alcaligenes]|uniref:hypothetical protein n=1 Tax=Aquipseudomonas alcaligenes TaxID=43263 RepID=UPI00358F195C
MRHVKVVIGFTPFHALFAARLLAQLEGEVYCLFTKGWPREGRPYRRLGFFSGRGPVFRALSYVASCLYFSLRIHSLFLRGYKVHLYAPHPSNIFTNYLFFARRTASVNVYEDGLLNYYDVPASRGGVSQGLKCLALLCGIPYRHYSGHLAGYDARRVDSLFVSRAGAVVSREKVGAVMQLSAVGGSIEPVARRVLFLDQDVSRFIPTAQRAALLARMSALYPPGEYEYFYKGHHDFVAAGVDMRSLSPELASRPAELVVGDLRPEIVVSFFSSALLNIAETFPGVKCLALAAGEVRISRDGNPGSLADIFCAAGVECLDMTVADSVAAAK